MATLTKLHSCHHRLGHSLALCLLAATSWSFVCVESSLGQSQVSIPTRGTRNTNALVVNVNAEFGASHHMGRATVQVTDTKGPSPADREIEVVFYNLPNNSDMECIAHRKRILLPEGTASVVVSMPFVDGGMHNYWDVGVFENGRDIENTLNRPRNTVSFQSKPSTNVQQFGLLTARGESLDGVDTVLTQLLNRASDVQATGTISTVVGNVVQNRTLTQLSDWFQQPIAGASTDWREYSIFAGWIVSTRGLDEFVERPEIVAAFRNYVASGGRLWVMGVETADDFARLERLLNDTPDPEGAARLWFKPDEKSPRTEFSSLEEVSSAVGQTQFLQRNYVTGLVLVSNQTLDSPESAASFESTIRGQIAVPPHAKIADDADGNWFWLNLIEAVGKPPVGMFSVIVALFGAILGPGLLYFTGRAGRRSLMIFLVPALASIAVCAVMSYGILHEGFETHIRITSVTHVDENNNTGFAWSRQNYFSGLPPRDGLVFRSDTYARPVSMNLSRNSYRGDPRRSVDCDLHLEDDQIWKGWLKPRQQQQMLVGHAIDQPQIPLRIQRIDSENIGLTNLTEQTLPFAVIRAAHNYYFSESVEAGQELTLEPVDESEVGRMVNRIMQPLRLRIPDGMRDGGTALNFNSRSTRALLGSSGRDAMNLAIKDYTSENLNMAPYSYATLLQENNQIEVPIEGQQGNGMHFVIGTSRW